MTAFDPHCFIHKFDRASGGRQIARLEIRAEGNVLRKILQKYPTGFDSAVLHKILGMGCGIGDTDVSASE